MHNCSNSFFFLSVSVISNVKSAFVYTRNRVPFITGYWILSVSFDGVYDQKNDTTEFMEGLLLPVHEYSMKLRVQKYRDLFPWCVSNELYFNCNSVCARREVYTFQLWISKLNIPWLTNNFIKCYRLLDSLILKKH